MYYVVFRGPRLSHRTTGAAPAIGELYSAFALSAFAFYEGEGREPDGNTTNLYSNCRRSSWVDLLALWCDTSTLHSSHTSVVGACYPKKGVGAEWVNDKRSPAVNRHNSNDRVRSAPFLPGFDLSAAGLFGDLSARFGN